MADKPKEVKQMDEKTRIYAANLLVRYGNVKAEMQALSQEVLNLQNVYGNFQLSVEPVVEKKLELVPKETINGMETTVGEVFDAAKKEGTNDSA